MRKIFPALAAAGMFAAIFFSFSSCTAKDMPSLKGVDCKAWTGFEDESIFALNEYYHEKGISPMKEEETSTVRKTARLRKTAYIQGLLDAFEHARTATNSDIFDFPFSLDEYTDGIDVICEEKTSCELSIIKALSDVNTKLKKR